MAGITPDRVWEGPVRYESRRPCRGRSQPTGSISARNASASLPTSMPNAASPPRCRRLSVTSFARRPAGWGARRRLTRCATRTALQLDLHGGCCSRLARSRSSSSFDLHCQARRARRRMCRACSGSIPWQVCPVPKQKYWASADTARPSSFSSAFLTFRSLRSGADSASSLQRSRCFRGNGVRYEAVFALRPCRIDATSLPGRFPLMQVIRPKLWQVSWLMPNA